MIMISPNVGTKHVSFKIAGCGVRKNGKVYAVTNTDRFDQFPFGYWLYKPPVLIHDIASWGICDQGVSYYTGPDGITHIFSVAGLDGYPNASDIVEEWYDGWASTLIPNNHNPDVLKLTPGVSRLISVSAVGYFDEYQLYRKQFQKLPHVPECFLEEGTEGYERHLKGEEMCASLHWQHVVGGKNADGRQVTCEVGDHSYPAIAPIEDHPTTNHYALVAWRPIDELHIIDSSEEPDKKDLNDALAFLTGATGQACQLPIFVTDH